jgi:hypothetical protein
MGFYIRPANYFDESPAIRMTRYQLATVNAYDGSDPPQVATATLEEEEVCIV